MHAKWKELVAGLILVVLVTSLYVEAGRETELIRATLKGYPLMAKPYFWPRVMLVGLLITGLPMLYLSARNSADRPSSNGIFAHILIPKVLISIAIVVLYCYLSQYLGFAFATILYTAVYMWFLGMRKIIALIAFPIVSTLVLLVVFWRLLYIAVPKGEGMFLTFSNSLMSLVRIGT